MIIQGNVCIHKGCVMLEFDIEKLETQNDFLKYLNKVPKKLQDYRTKRDGNIYHITLIESSEYTHSKFHLEFFYIF